MLPGTAARSLGAGRRGLGSDGRQEGGQAPRVSADVSESWSVLEGVDGESGKGEDVHGREDGEGGGRV